MRRDERPGTLVLRLFLTPQYFGLGEAVEFQRQNIFRERIKLFDAQDLDAALIQLFARFHQIEINLAAAQDDALDLTTCDKLDGRSTGHDFSLVAQHAMKGRARTEIGEE